MTDRHVMECLGMTRVVIEDGQVTEVGTPMIKYCPLFKKYRGINEITPEIVRENIEFRIKSFGMCTEDRDLRMKDFLSFGISEILSSALKQNLIDAAVIAADGCGTAVITDPEIVQGLGGRISGMCFTSPLKNVIDCVGETNIVDIEKTTINAIDGTEKAISLGHSKIAVTVASADDAKHLRETYGKNLLIIAVHTSCTSAVDAVRMFDLCDIITACASSTLREESRRRDIVVAGNKVPVYGVSDAGKDLVLMRLKEVGKEPWDGTDAEEPPYPLI